MVADEGFVNQFKENKASVQEWNRGGVAKFKGLAEADAEGEELEG